MTVQFTDLEILAQHGLDLKPIEVLAKQVLQYQDATPQEILELLEEVAHSYAVLAPTLSPNLRYSARKEIEFFAFLYQDSLKKLTNPHKVRESQESVQSLSHCVRAIVDDLLNSKKCQTLQTFEIAPVT
ncbi:MULTISPECIES: hypothetical protein [Aerosakkonema]|uniref:hypothetical protein n=1 Tax=Aerosakkonema TaxID=1246629 RepID=UPI0035B8DF8A